MTDNIIDVDAVLVAARIRRQVNKIDIRDAVFMRDGKVLEVSWERRGKFRFTGLSVDYFVDANFALSEAL